MTNRILLLLLLIPFFKFSQNTLGTISVTTDVYIGYTLFSTHKKAYLIDNCGQVINSWTSDYTPGNAVYLLPNGNLLRTGKLEIGTNSINIPGSGGIVELFDWEGNIIWSWIDSSDTSRQHHDVFPMPNGNILILAATVLRENEAIEAGRNPSLINNGELYNERIYEIEPSGVGGLEANYDGDIIWEWNIKDHLIQDFDDTKNNFGVVADNPGKLNVNFLNGWPVDNNWLHINSIQYDEEFDQIIISPRRMSEIWIIDHNTSTAEAKGAAGDFLYRWGNPQAYNQGVEADRKLHGQHTPYYIPSGYPNERKIMIFNNGLDRTPLYSESLIISPPVDSNGNYNYTPNTAFDPTEPFYKYPETAPSTDSEFYSAIVSSSRQLPNGNILICEGRDGYFFEIDSNNNIVWEYITPISNADGTIYEQGDSVPPNNLTFRATKYSKDYAAFTGKILNPGEPIENNSNITSCLNTLDKINFNSSDVTISPNPSSNFITINCINVIDKVELFNTTGYKISEYLNTKDINISNFKSGIYFLKIYINGKKTFKKIIKQ